MFVIRHVSDYSRLQPDHCVVGLAAAAVRTTPTQYVVNTLY